jgi:hypothetical protein
MEFVFCEQVFNAFGEKKKIFRKAFIPRCRSLIKIARRAPLPLTILFPWTHETSTKAFY